MEIYNIIFGLILLVFGRKLFWLFIAIAGFLFGMEITGMFFGAQPQWVQLTMAIGLGCLGALLAMLAQRLAFTIGGFFAGVFLAFKASQFLAVPDHSTMFLMIIIGGGALGAVGATLIIDKAITVLACLVGAGAIVGELSLDHSLYLVGFIFLAGAGFVIQERLWPAAKGGRLIL